MRRIAIWAAAFGLACAAGAARAQTPAAPALEDTSIEDLLGLRVQTATLRKQSIAEVPASVTVVTAEDIRRYGFRTLGEVLSNTRSFYVSPDGAFQYVGVRGFSVLGDYNTRFLVLVNGHCLTDNVYSSMYYFGEDFPIDLGLVRQIEIVRGPGSSLYGSNGLFATINIITVTPESAPRLRMSATAGSFGTQKLTTSAAFSSGKGIEVLLSASASRTSGYTATFAERLADGTLPATARHLGQNRGYHLFSVATWKDWTLTAVFGQSLANPTNGWYRSEFGNTGTSDLDSRDYIELAWNRAVGERGELRWRSHYDRFRYDGVYAYDDGSRNCDGALGDWVGTELTWLLEQPGIGTLTIGGELNIDLRNLQYNRNALPSASDPDPPYIFRISQPRKSAGIYLQQQVRLSDSWTAYLGGRLDATTHDDMVFSPRLGLIHKYARGTNKFLYGRAFRNPSTFERYWEPNLRLDAEHIDTVEFANQSRLSKHLQLITSAYQYQLGNLIMGVPVRPDTLQYQNASKARALGAEIELQAQLAEWLETRAGFSIERSRQRDESERLANSPAKLGHFIASVPLVRQRVIVSAAARYVGSRLDAYFGPVPSVTLADLTVTLTRPRSGLQLQAGIRNLLDRGYADPLSAEHATRVLPGQRRSFFVTLTWAND